MPTPAQIIPPISDETEVSLVDSDLRPFLRGMVWPLGDFATMFDLNEDERRALYANLSIRLSCRIGTKGARVMVVAAPAVVDAPQRGAA